MLNEEYAHREVPTLEKIKWIYHEIKDTYDKF
jgi:hypothetical protein